MRVKRDFERLYRNSPDPWAIGDADSDRYQLYRRVIRENARRSGRILDIGCGNGAFLAQFRGEYKELVGVELSASAVAQGRDRHPYIDFHVGSAGRLDETPVSDAAFDTIVLSDVVYYLSKGGRLRALEWIADHLESDGLAFVAAWAPGGDYLTADELRRLTEQYFAIERFDVLDSGHVVIAARPRLTLVALTIDYETWQPIPPGRRIDWEADVFSPTAALLEAFDGVPASFTLFAELGEHAWLRQHSPLLARRMEQQWAETVARGHDVQLHLHPTWLPELGARCDDGEWTWDWSKARAHDYPGDLTQLLAECKQTLLRAIGPMVPEYRVTAFRAGAYEAQPFARIYDALAANDIVCDSSVYADGIHPERHYDYRLAYSAGQPYFASRYDPQLKAPPAERAIIELPILALGNGQRWSFDPPDCSSFADTLVKHVRALRAREPSPEAMRRRYQLQRVLSRGYHDLRSMRPLINRALPKRLMYLMTPYERETLVRHDYCVLVGHTKSDLDIPSIMNGVGQLLAQPRVRLITVSDMVARAQSELQSTSSASALEEAERQVRREYDAVLGADRNDRQSHHLQDRIPRDRRRILDVGCGTGRWSARIAELLPQAEVVGVDVGTDFISRAQVENASRRVSFAVEDFRALSFEDESFDCIYADNSLEHAFDVDATLAELWRVLEPGGTLVAAIPSDARNRNAVCDNHTWKTAPHDVRARLHAAGYHNIEIDEVDTYRKLGMPPFPPSRDRVMYVTAWRLSA